MKKNRFKDTPFFSKRETYEPWYDDNADYNTNAKSYYDYLARFNHLISSIIDFINRALDRNMNFENTSSINFTKDGDWQSDEDCEVNKYDDIVHIKAVVNISDENETKTLTNTPIKTFTINNGSKVKETGVWSPDFTPMVGEIDKELGNIQDEIVEIHDDIREINQDITDIKKDITDIQTENAILRSGLQKIVNNLNNSGAINNNDINSFTFISGRNIATGNINLFGGTQDGNSTIRTNKGSTENDITAGV